jgi:hypothetical protein
MTSAPEPLHPLLAGEVSRRLERALAVVRLAAPATLRWFHAADYTVIEKEDRSPVTEADRAAVAGHTAEVSLEVRFVCSPGQLDFHASHTYRSTFPALDG